MPKVINSNPYMNRVSTSTRQVVFQLNFNSYDNVTVSGTVTLRVATKEDFSDASIVTPSNFYTRTIGTSNWSSSVGGNTVTTAQQALELRVDLSALSAETKQYVKVLFTVGGVVYEATPILFTNLTEIDFKLQTPINFGVVQPQKVKVTDRIVATIASAYTIKVEACNNANDVSPTWENMTTQYLNGQFFAFTNKTKTAASWAINVKYYIKKANATDSIEISDLYVAYL